MTMAESSLEAHVAPSQDKTNNNHPMVVNHNHRPIAKQRKRKRLSQVLDKLTGGGAGKDEDGDQHKTLNNNLYNNNEGDKEALKKKHYVGEVFRFESVERLGKQTSEEDDVFSPAGSSNKSPHSSTESPRISFSPLRIKEDNNSPSPPLIHRPPVCSCFQCVSGAGHHPPSLHPYDRFFPASPISPLTPASPAPSYNFERYLHSKYLPDFFRRRSHSDSDLPLWLDAAKSDKAAPQWTHPLTLPSSRGSTEPETSVPQEYPLDLSMKSIKAREKAASSLECLSGQHGLQMMPAGFLPPRGAVSVPVVKGDVASPTTKESVASRYNLEVSPVVEEMPPGSDVAFVCPVCGQMFSLHDRLAKHMASRHKSRQTSGESTAKAYLCEVCKRSFARSDMLTRHMRLHTGVKPYTCRVCGQVFSRSDHLSTHQRTHTGEKPYKCPQCPYAACRRDMITRHMRTHTRYEPENLNTPPTIKTESSQ